jgi:hypothetical protein
VNEQQRAIERFADIVCVELGKLYLPRFGEHWHAVSGVGDTGTVLIAGVSIHEDAGRAVVDGIVYDADTPMSTLVAAIYAKTDSAFPLRAGERYRLRLPLKGYSAGEVLTFVGERQLRPDVDTRYYTFDATKELREGRQEYDGFGLAETNPVDASVMHAMHDWFEWVEDPVDARKYRIRSLALVGRHLREHGELEAAERRLREALTLQPDHAMAISELGKIASLREQGHR